LEVTVELGEFGAWLGPQNTDAIRKDVAVEAEKLGYGTVWLGIGRATIADLAFVEEVLAATSSVTVATAIVNMWSNDPVELAASYHRVTERYGDRFLLGVGVGHPESVNEYQSPYDKMVDYLDRLDAEGVPADRRILAALGNRALSLAADRTAGAHPYLVVPTHTRRARRVLGTERLLAPEHKVVVAQDPTEARAIGRPFVHKPYLGLSNYVNNLRRLGYAEEDIAGAGSDRLIDDLVLHGTSAAIAQGLREHFTAGADHVGIHVLGQDVSAGYRALAEVLF
jgi:probable F420-dependent oxidoreductase